MNKNEILVLDIETTGFNPKNDLILELGIVKLNLETGEITELFDKIFKHERFCENHHNAWIFKNNFMNVNEVENAKSIEVYRDEINKILEPFQGKITAWNRDFDAGFLKENGFNLGNYLACPMKVSTNYFQIPSLRGSSFKWPKAQEAWNILFPETKKIEKHRGLDDSVMEAKIIHRLFELGVYKPF